jgi:hypothetical protein
MGLARVVNVEEVKAAALMGDLEAEFVAVRLSGPVCNAVCVDLGAYDTDTGGVRIVACYIGAQATLGERTGRGGGSRSDENGCD